MTAAPQIPVSPHGYPELGLAARTLSLRFRRDANLTRLARRLESWEHDRGNTKFRAFNLSRLPADVAFELVHVYVALREIYPNVRPDFVDFSSSDPDASLAWAFSYHDAYPKLRELAAEVDGEIDLGEDEPTDELLAWVRNELNDPSMVRQVRSEIRAARTSRARDLTATGAIEIGQIFRTRRSYRKLLAFWETYNARCERLGRPARCPEMALSPAAGTLVHEFGHLVEAELLDRGFSPVERTYRDLSTILLGTTPRSVYQWRRHLINYPSYDYTPVQGPVAGAALRARSTKKALKQVIGERIGSYAPTSRDEIFAESFAVAHGARSPRLRRDLAPFLARLRTEGLAVSRRPRRTV
jgi:hypothetical protein